MNRFKELEKLQAAARAEIPGVAVAWLEAARKPLEALTMAALDPSVTDDEFRHRVQVFAHSLPDLMDKLNHEALARLMEESMGAAMAGGMAARDADFQAARKKPEDKTR